MSSSAVLQREKRKTAGRRMTSLVGKALEEDDAFWGHETWLEEGSDNDSFHESDEDSNLQKDVFDSDFNDSESDNDEEEKAAGEAEERELQRQERSNSQRKSTYQDIARGGRSMMAKKKGKGKRIMGDGMNAGLVLNFPPPTSVVSATISSQPALPTPVAGVATPLPPKKPARKAQSGPTLASHRSRRSQQRKLRDTRSTPSDSHAGRKHHGKPIHTKKIKRRRYKQEELLLEAVNETEPENQRWLLARKRVQDLAEKDKDISMRDKARGKVIQKYHSRRGCLITLTFPEMDAVPEILTRPKSAPPKPEKVVCIITGKPARYRDPSTKMGYFDSSAFKELRRRQKAGEPLDQRPKSGVVEPEPADENVATRNGLGALSTSEETDLTPVVACPNPITTTSMTSQSSSTISKNVQNNTIAPTMNSPPVSPGGRRLSSRKRKLSEKLLQNMNATPGEKGLLAAGLQLKPLAISTSQVGPIKNGEDTVPREAPGGEADTSSTVPGPTNPGTNTSGKGTGREEILRANKSATVGARALASTQGKRIHNSSSAGEEKTASGSKEGKAAVGTAASKKTKAPETISSSDAGKNLHDLAAPAEKVNPSKTPGMPSSLDTQVGTSKSEEMYVWPQDTKGGNKKARYLTQSELIMEVITNYSKKCDERENSSANRN